MATNPKKLVELKNELRKEFSQRRSSISKIDREIRSNQITEHLINLNEVADASNILVYWSFGHEASTRALIKELQLRKKQILLPYLEANLMHAAKINSTDSLELTTYGPLEPPDKTPVDPSTVDIVIVPGLAFDRNGFRLGYGRGFYDRYLSALGDASTTIGFCFSSQIAEQVPAEPHDVALDILVTDREVIRIASRSHRG